MTDVLLSSADFFGQDVRYVGRGRECQRDGSIHKCSFFSFFFLAKRKGDVGGESVSWVKMLGIHHQGKEEERAQKEMYCRGRGMMLLVMMMHP